ncbi:unnamed protein product, partial [Allacma fusca]
FKSPFHKDTFLVLGSSSNMVHYISTLTRTSGIMSDRRNKNEEERGESIPRNQRNRIWIGDQQGWFSVSQSTVGVVNFAGNSGEDSERRDCFSVAILCILCTLMIMLFAVIMFCKCS